MSGKRIVGDSISIGTSGGAISFHQVIGNEVNLDSSGEDGEGVQASSIYGKVLNIVSGEPHVCQHSGMHACMCQRRGGWGRPCSQASMHTDLSMYRLSSSAEGGGKPQQMRGIDVR